MFGRKIRFAYYMSQRQFDEMKQFYETLGLSKKQVKRLCEKCFGTEIIVRDEYYSDNWTFSRRIIQEERKRRAPEEECGALSEPIEDCAAGLSCGMPAPGAQMNMRAAMPMMGMQMASAQMGMGGMGMAGMGMPGMGIPAGMPAPQAEDDSFNTVETNDVPENEQHSPLDSPQLIFSANVNTASWLYTRNMILRKRHIDPAMVRIEEMINSYPYKLKKPEKDELFEISAENGRCPWNKDSELLFLGFKGRKAKKNCKQNLSLLVDVSGSMDDEWVLVQMSMAAIISKLRKGDIISIIAYSDETVTVAKDIDCGDTDDCIDAILSIDGIGGCTNGSEGLENAYKYLSENYDKEANNRVFIFTDGDFNFGVTGEGGLRDFIYKKRETGIYLSIVGYGEHNLKDNKMEALARNGNGNYTFVSNPQDILDQLWEKLVSGLVTVAKDVKISVELNPAFVSEYRLIGYDARILTQQEFHDTEKAVDGIGSEHNVVALIELKRGRAEKKYSSRYVNVSAQENGKEFAFIEVHYKSPEGEDLVMTHSVGIDELEDTETKNIRAASLIASFGLLLKDSDYKGNMNKDRLSDLWNEVVKKPEKVVPYSHFAVIKDYLEY